MMYILPKKLTKQYTVLSPVSAYNASTGHKRLVFSTTRHAAEGSPSNILGQKVEKWLQTPFDILAFGPRATFGALLTVSGDLQALQGDVQKFTDLVQDSTSLEEKQRILFEEAERTVVSFLEKGATVEADILSNVKTILPADVAEQLIDWIPPNPVGHRVDQDDQSCGQGPNDQARPLDEGAQQLQKATTALRFAMNDVATNVDPAYVADLHEQLQVARIRVADILRDINVDDANEDLRLATRDATALIMEVDAQFQV